MTQLLQNAVFGTALILAAAILRRALGGRLLPEVRLTLWFVCLIRLLAPVFPASGLSLWGLLPWAGTDGAVAPGVDPAPLPGGAAGNLPSLTAPAPVSPGFTPVEPAGAAFPWETVLLSVWIGVGLLLAARYALSWNRTRRAVAQAVPLPREDSRYAALPKCARLREGVMDGAPLTFGAARPTVVLSPGLSGEALECVLAHEGVHARRRDNLWHYVMAAALVVYWWNPAVWLMARLLRRDIELACDRAAVKRLGAGKRAQYAQTLVSMATVAEGPAFCQTFGRKAAEERILSVMKFKKTTVLGAVLSLTLVAGVTVGFASNPAERLPDEESTTSSAPAPMLYTFSHSPEGELLKISISLDCLRDSLAEHAADGSMTQAEADGILERAEALSQDGVMLEWTFTGPSGLFTHTDSHQEGFDVYYLDADGHEAPVDPAGVVERFILPDSTAKGDADDVEPTPAVQPTESGLVPAIGTKGEEGYIRESDIPGRPGVDVKNPEEALAFMEWLKTQPEELLIPLYNAQGNVIGQFAVGNSMGQGNAYVKYDGRVYNRADLSQETLEWLDWYLALPEEEQKAVSYEPAELWDGETPAGADDAPAIGELGSSFYDYTIVGTDENGYPVDGQGNSLVFDDSGKLFMKVRSGYAPCVRMDCDISQEHHHEGAEVVYHYDTLPAEIPVCPVEGCTVRGTHTHDGVTYLCNGAHCGGACNGSCHSYAGNGGGAASPAAPVSSGHHGAGHGNGYRGGHH